MDGEIGPTVYLMARFERRLWPYLSTCGRNPSKEAWSVAFASIEAVNLGVFGFRRSGAGLLTLWNCLVGIALIVPKIVFLIFYSIDPCLVATWSAMKWGQSIIIQNWDSLRTIFRFRIGFKIELVKLTDATLRMYIKHFSMKHFTQYWVIITKLAQNSFSNLKYHKCLMSKMSKNDTEGS